MRLTPDCRDFRELSAGIRNLTVEFGPKGGAIAASQSVDLMLERRGAARRGGQVGWGKSVGMLALMSSIERRGASPPA